MHKNLCYNITCMWGYSSVGRALGSHSRGQGFESPYLHHKRRSESCGVTQFHIFHGGIAQLGECLTGSQEVTGSSPVISTKSAV